MSRAPDAPLRVEFLGTGGATTIPRPLCDCPVCRQARERGVPYARGGPSLFVHGPDVLVDTPPEITVQLNRSSVRRIATCLYSHWHPDHTMGRHVLSTINVDYRTWPPRPRGTIDVHLPPRVAVDARRFLALWDHLRFLEDVEHVIRLHELPEGAALQLGSTVVRPLPLAVGYAYAFLFEQGARRVLVAPDELESWRPPAAVRGVDLAVLAMGVCEHHPLTGERLIAAEHPVLRNEATFAETLDIVDAIAPRRTLLTHIEESDGLGHDELAEVAQRLRETRGLDIGFAHDTMTIDV